MARTKHESTAEKRDDDDETGSRASRGAGRGIWNGSISFGLLQIPVTLYSAEQRSEKIHFRLLDKKSGQPIRYERVNSKTGRKVEWEQIVKGYEITKDEYVILEPEELAKANVKATQTIDIQDFVPKDQIDPAFFETPYYVVPQKRAAKAYVLLRQALEKKGAVAIATFVLRTKEHLVAVMPVGEALMLEVLRFGHELKDASVLPLPSASAEKEVQAREVKMAEQLIEGMMSDWDPKKYRDRHHLDLKKIIAEKAKTGTVKEHHAKVGGTVATDDVIDLLDLLKKSVGAANDAKPGPAKAKSRGRAARSRTSRTKRSRAA